MNLSQRVFGLVLVAVSIAIAQPSAQVFQLSSGPNPDFIPVVDGTTYVSQRGASGNMRIMMWSEGDAAPVQISSTLREALPRMDDGRVVWQSDASGGDFEIKLWENGSETTLTANTEDDTTPDIGGFAKAWLFNIAANTWVVRYDDGVAQIDLTANTGAGDAYPSVMNDWLTGEAGSPKNIFFWNIGAPFTRLEATLC